MRLSWSDIKSHGGKQMSKDRVRTLRFAIQLGALCLIFSHSSAAAVPLALSNGSVNATVNLNSSKITILLSSHIVDIGRPSDPFPRHRTNNCTYSAYPCKLVDALELKVSGRPITIPRSVFSDLADVGAAQITTIGAGKFQLVLDGGDASESYTVKIIFDKHRVRERIVVGGESQQVSERTLYYDDSSAFVDLGRLAGRIRAIRDS